MLEEHAQRRVRNRRARVCCVRCRACGARHTGHGNFEGHVWLATHSLATRAIPGVPLIRLPTAVSWKANPRVVVGTVIPLIPTCLVIGEAAVQLKVDSQLITRAIPIGGEQRVPIKVCGQGTDTLVHNYLVGRYATDTLTHDDALEI